MKVVCKNNQIEIIDDEPKQQQLCVDHLIIDKIYEVLDTDVTDFKAPTNLLHLIENELGQRFWYSSNRFIRIEESRNNKLNELGI